MSKKGKQNKAQTKETIMVDQQKEPCLKALQKKVRNLNKKLTQIAELENRNDLKPEQEEKVSKKKQTLAEREKYFEFTRIYKDIVADNEKSFREWQLLQIKDIAALIVANEFGFTNEYSTLSTILTKPGNSITLEERLIQVSDTLIKLAENQKLKKKVAAFNHDNKQKIINHSEKVEEQENNVSQQQEKEDQKAEDEEIKEPEQKVTSQEKDEIPPPQKTEVPNDEKREVSQKQENKSEEKIIDSQKNPENEDKGENNEKKEETKDQKRKPYQNRQRRERRNFDRKGNNYHQDGNGQMRKDRTKKRYQEKNPSDKKQEEENDSSSLGSTPEPREFKREEVRELIEDGFIVVGKPKVKAHNQKQWHEHTHGHKAHHHHKKTNN